MREGKRRKLNFFALEFESEGILVVQLHFPTDEETRAQRGWTLGNFPKKGISAQWKRKPGMLLCSQPQQESTQLLSCLCTYVGFFFVFVFVLDEVKFTKNSVQFSGI